MSEGTNEPDRRPLVERLENYIAGMAPEHRARMGGQLLMESLWALRPRVEGKAQKVPCCNYAWDPKTHTQPYPVMWNPFNEVVQCHNCGVQWEPTRRET